VARCYGSNADHEWRETVVGGSVGEGDEESGQLFLSPSSSKRRRKEEGD
jgi:hypothetical protein